MTSRRTSLRLGLSMGLSALLLAVAGALTPAAAATNWSYWNDFGQPCLRSSTASTNVWVSTTCPDNSSVWWHWGTESNQWGGHTMRRLVSNANGGCLTTDVGAETNAVRTEPCGNRSGQFWTADGDYFRNQNGNYLRTSPSGDGVYTSPWSVIADYNIDITRFVWWGLNSSGDWE
ncbi:hypothetical protein ACFY3G_19600 [Streptomyces phaeochromogenes]|uniref:hypothetical protein n=1 Tax=Streptomyces phaeochromogenes TaxID=1923 RepID=UPI0036D0602A